MTYNLFFHKNIYNSKVYVICIYSTYVIVIYVIIKAVDIFLIAFYVHTCTEDNHKRYHHLNNLVLPCSP